MELYTYFRSSAAYRVRIILNLKGLDADYRYVHLVQDGGQQHAPDYAKLNPQELVPALTDGDRVLTQSLAICEYLEDEHPEVSTLPADAPGRARVRALAQVVACDIHPLNNLRVLKYLENELEVDKDARIRWYRHWVEEGFRALETLLDDPRTGRYCHGSYPTLADACLVPQVYNARRFGCDMDAFPTIQRIDAECLALEEFRRAAPEQQEDAG
jgi:maleylacetoacetate isomerase